MKALISVMFLFTLSSLHAQTIWHIPTTGADSNSGLTASEAFATVSHAIGFASYGDSIYVFGGTYHEKINAYLICPENNRVIIQGVCLTDH